MTIKTNKNGIAFIRQYIAGKAAILGVEATDSNISRKEQTLIVLWTDGRISAIVIPQEHSKESGSCIFGPLEYFAKIYAAEKAGITLQYTSGTVIHPKWYENDHLKMEVYNEQYNKMINKYKQDTL